METRHDKIKNMTTKEFAEYLRKEQLNSIFTGIAFSVPQIIKYLEEVECN